MVPDRSLLPLVSLSGLLVAEAGAEELVGVVMSMGSPGDGADIFMVGVRIGTVLAPIGSSERSSIWFRGALSVIVAICREFLTSISNWNGSNLRQSVGRKTKVALGNVGMMRLGSLLQPLEQQNAARNAN